MKPFYYVWFGMGCLVSAGYFFLYYLIFDPGGFLFWFNLSVVAAFSILLSIAKWGPAKDFFFMVGVVLAYFAFLIHIISTGGIYSSAAPHLFVAALFSFFYNDQRRIYFYFSASIALLCLLGAWNIWVEEPFSLIPQKLQKSFDLTNHLYLAVTVFFFVYVFRYQARAYSRSLKKSMAELGDTTKKLVEAEKFASLGEMTAGLAHEINNPVNYVQGNAILIRKIVSDLSRLETLREKQDRELKDFLQKGETSGIRELVQEMLQAIDVRKREMEYDIIKKELDQLLDGLRHGVRKTSEIVQSLRIYSSAGNTIKNDFSLNDSVESALTILNHLIVGKVEVQKSLGKIPRVFGNPGKVSQVIMNVVSNGIQAIESYKKGIISVKTFEDTTLDQVVVSISDNGPGIPEDIRTKIFDPFFTTKEVGMGTGLGLSISKGIIDEHEGNISVESEIGKGTTFHISIPKYKAP